jgi:hypothetical protein
MTGQIGILASGLDGEVTGTSNVRTVSAGGLFQESASGTAKALQVSAPGLLAEAVAASTGPQRVSATSANGTTANWSVSLPSGSGGLLVITVAGSGGGWTVPSGFTMLFSAKAGGNGKWLSVCYKYASGTEAATLSNTNGADTHGWGVTCVRYSGVNATTPFTGAATQTTSTASATGSGTATQSIAANGPTTTTANALICMVAGVDSYSSTTQIASAFTTPSGFQNKTALVPVNYGNLFTAEKLQPAAGAAGTATTVASIPSGSTTQGWNAYQYAINSA